MKNGGRVDYEDSYLLEWYLCKEWETYASHFGLTSPLNMEDFEGRWSEDFGKGSVFTANLLRTNQFDVEKTVVVWIASFCRDLMQDYALFVKWQSSSHGQSPIFFGHQTTFKMNKLFGQNLWHVYSRSYFYLTVCWRI